MGLTSRRLLLHYPTVPFCNFLSVCGVLFFFAPMVCCQTFTDCRLQPQLNKKTQPAGPTGRPTAVVGLSTKKKKKKKPIRFLHLRDFTVYSPSPLTPQSQSSK